MKKEYDIRKLKDLKILYPAAKKPVGIKLSTLVVDYFKHMSKQIGLPYQRLIDLYLLDCVRTRRKLKMKWVA